MVARLEAPVRPHTIPRACGSFVTVTKGIPIQKPAVNEATKKAAGVFARLLAACDRLRRVVMHNEGGANKDLARFADQINSLCDKWDR